MATTGTVKYTFEQIIGNTTINAGTGLTLSRTSVSGSFPSGSYKITGASLTLQFRTASYYDCVVSNNSGNTLGTIDAQSSGAKSLSSRTVSHYTNITSINLVSATSGQSSGELSSGQYPVLTVTYEVTDVKTTIGTLTSSSEIWGTVALTATANASGLSHKYRVVFGSSQSALTDCTTSGTSVTASYTIPTAFAGVIPNATSGTATMYLYTYNSSGSLIGSDSKTFTITIPASFKPRIDSLTVTAGNKQISDTYILQGLSTATVAFSASENNGSGTSYYAYVSKVVLSGSYSKTITYSGSNAFVSGSIEIDPLTISGTNTFTITVTDTRGRTSSSTVTLDVNAYEAPKLSGITVQRCDSTGTASVTGTCVLLTTVTEGTSITNSGTEVNSLTLNIQCQKVGESTWADLGDKTLGVASASTGHILTTWDGTNAFGASDQFTLRLTLSDAVTENSSITRSVAAGFVLMRWEPENKAFGFGTYPSGSNRLEIASDWDVYRSSVGVFDSLASGLIHRGPMSAVSTDYDDLTETGIYYADVTSPSNGPSNIANYGEIFVVRYNTRVEQMYVRGATAKSIQCRSRNSSGVWDSWHDAGGVADLQSSITPVSLWSGTAATGDTITLSSSQYYLFGINSYNNVANGIGFRTGTRIFIILGGRVASTGASPLRMGGGWLSTSDSGATWTNEGCWYADVSQSSATITKATTVSLAQIYGLVKINP